MPLLSLQAVFMRGGTSRAVMFHARDLPDRAEWDPIFLPPWAAPIRTDGSSTGWAAGSRRCRGSASWRRQIAPMPTSTTHSPRCRSVIRASTIAATAAT